MHYQEYTFLLVYPDKATLRQVYSSYIGTALSGNNEVVIVFPFYETTDSVRRVLGESEFGIDVKKRKSAFACTHGFSESTL